MDRLLGYRPLSGETRLDLERRPGAYILDTVGANRPGHSHLDRAKSRSEFNRHC